MRNELKRYALEGLTFLAALCGLWSVSGHVQAQQVMPATTASRQGNCRRAVLEGQVVAGQGYEKVFTPGLKFYLEPLRSGWIVRVLAADAPRGPHDFAELATPPYQSVSPLLISTDWSFRAQDAVAWNPRVFRYARDKATLRELEALLPGVLADQPASAGKLAELVAKQPEAKLEVLDSKFAPGVADQAKMASAVASHLATTPHEADQNAAPSPLGRLETMHFRVRLDLTSGHAAPGVREEPCVTRPTVRVAPASQHTSTRTSR